MDINSLNLLFIRFTQNMLEIHDFSKNGQPSLKGRLIKQIEL